ncbi:site-specific DNA-methyltransferase [Bosea sp. 124]|uniref:DNA-methyltransferase n=1 Tax=Bosea sp. 124 TaxID=2135642 RepID=UPI0015E696F3|nr:site-specific DNA-methyltransferase [Bosea sp. 124]
MPAIETLKLKGQTAYFSSSAHMKNVADDSVDFFITSPPYWNLKNYGSPDEIGQGNYEFYLEKMNEVWQECYRVGKNNSVLVINVNSRRHLKQFYPIAFDIVRLMKGWKLHDNVTWYIPNALPQPNAYIERLLDNKFEYVLVFTKNGNTDYKFHKPRVPQKYMSADPRANKNSKGRCLGNVLRIPAYRPPNIKKMNYHVAAFPEELVSFFLECYTDKKDVVLDPFLGSGTTLKVSSVMGRVGIGYELNPEFKPLVRARIEELWDVPDWKRLDVLHSATNDTKPVGPRKAHFAKIAKGGPGLFEDD